MINKTQSDRKKSTYKNAFGDQARSFDAVADGVVDAFAVDHPVFHWTCNSTERRCNGNPTVSNRNYRDEPGDLKGEDYLEELYRYRQSFLDDTAGLDDTAAA